jgi:DNA-binding transcriptional LysR family regulator
MDRWLAMRIFVQVAETASFAKAARQMQLSAPVVTRTVAGLEELVGARLLVRTTRSVKTTEAGARYLEDCRRILAEIAEAEAAAAGHYDQPSGTLSVTAALLFGQLHVLPIVTGISRSLSGHAGAHFLRGSPGQHRGRGDGCGGAHRPSA